ncbi:hypothetical protein PHYPO_G00112050 [Pangasianodon hypophthalmus]|uniref:Uncharacterized protein n=1 Tax=Pangasianodon hypophthalmus TaxID=310915 RepID=A0A5N5L2P3_PANHP|nr:hypothetical protein PHYPO_G00112050 [Pangasianodon hypophthalmus]
MSGVVRMRAGEVTRSVPECCLPHSQSPRTAHTSARSRSLARISEVRDVGPVFSARGRAESPEPMRIC